MLAVLPFLLPLLSAPIALAAATTIDRVSAHSTPCFPFGSASFHNSLQLPHSVHSREEWWCPQSTFYGFLGFSYPMEYQCSAEPFEKIDADFRSMKRDFGARMVRVYLPQCYDTSIWESLLRAGVANDMAVILQVAWPLNGDEYDSWALTASSILSVLQHSEYKSLAPYVFHSAEFGTEPIGDQDGGPSYQPFIQYLTNFRNALKPYGIPVGISEDWDRPGIMSNNDSTGIGPIGSQILPLSDFVHAHVMPYYHNDYTEAESWAYIRGQVEWYKRYIPDLPMIISETQWAWAFNTLHQGGAISGFAQCDCGPAQYTNFWKNYDQNCNFFKEKSVGWFIHAWEQEGTFNMLMPNGTYAIKDWRPQVC